MLLAVRKVIGTFPNMITLGRTSNNDIVVPDVSISKFHAWFQRLGDRVEVGDAGSKNGTAVNGETLPPRGARVLVKRRLGRGGSTTRRGRLDTDLLAVTHDRIRTLRLLRVLRRIRLGRLRLRRLGLGRLGLRGLGLGSVGLGRLDLGGLR